MNVLKLGWTGHVKFEMIIIEVEKGRKRKSGVPPICGAVLWIPLYSKTSEGGWGNTENSDGLDLVR